jgi:predicted CoA-binding protein
MTIAIIGASSRRHKFSNKAVRAWKSKDATVVPVHPQENAVEGLPVVRSVEEIDGAVDVATFYVPPAVGITLLEGCARKGVGVLWLNPGSASPELLRRAEELGLAYEQTCSIIRAGYSPSQFSEE